MNFLVKEKGMLEQSQVIFKLSMIDDMLRIRNVPKAISQVLRQKTISPYTQKILIFIKIYKGDRILSEASSHLII